MKNNLQSIALYLVFSVCLVYGTLYYTSSLKQELEYRKQLLSIKNEIHTRVNECSTQHEKIILDICKPTEYKWKVIGYKTIDECLTENRGSFCGRYYDVLNIQ